MSTDVQTAFTLFLIGMLSVFTILALVVLSGRVLISVVNRYFSGEASRPAVSTGSMPSKPRVERKKLTAIIAAVEQVSGGQATITKIERSKS